MLQKNSNTSTKFTSQSREPAVLRARVNTIAPLVAARLTGAMGLGMHDRVALVESCAGSPTPLVRRTVTEQNFPMHLFWFLPSRACVV
jgi:hypothetical protein